MGGNHSNLTEDELKDYKELTHLTRREILLAFSRFKKLDWKRVDEDKFVRLPFDRIIAMPEFRNNPFKDRLCSVFSSLDDEQLSFEDFLDMISVLSPEAPAEKKAAYAFRVYDFDDDGYLSEDDLCQMVRRLTPNRNMDSADCQMIAKKVMSEVDLDKDQLIGPAEFQHVVLKSGDFCSTFQLKL